MRILHGVPKMAFRIGVSVIGLIAVVAFLYLTIYRPWSLNWGASDEEINRGMNADHILEQPTFIATRAISIKASPEDIWPWIIQIGYRRAGFYSYDRLDNDGIHSSDHILPDFQALQVGDFIPMTKDFNAVVTELDPHRPMVMEFQPWVWAWGLYETDDDHTRLVTRVYYQTDRMLTNFFVDTFEIFMMRKCLLGIKQRVEAAVN